MTSRESSFKELSRKFFTDLELVAGFLEFLESLSGTALQTDYNISEFVEFLDCEKLYGEIAKSYKAVKLASDIESSSAVSEPVFVPEKLPEQRCRTEQRSRIDFEKTQHVVFGFFVYRSVAIEP